MRTLIKGGRIITAVDDYVADVLIDGETISTIGRDLSHAESTNRSTPPASWSPGGIDPHTHDLPFGGTSSSDDFETGTRAAAFGGTTTIIDFAFSTRVRLSTRLWMSGSVR
jgi:dihydropyrimidinase